MKHFWIAFIIFLLACALAGHGVLTVWMAHVKVERYQAVTERLRDLDYACQGIEQGRDLAFVIDGETFKCSDIRINYVPSRERATML